MYELCALGSWCWLDDVINFHSLPHVRPDVSCQQCRAALDMGWLVCRSPAHRGVTRSPACCKGPVSHLSGALDWIFRR